MSRLTETKCAYDKLVNLLDQEILNRRGSSRALERFRETLDVSFYLLAWSQFEHLVKNEARELIEVHAAVGSVDATAWKYMLTNVKSLSLRKQLELIFHANHKTLTSLNKDYDVRNDAAHDYKLLPKEARDVSNWIDSLEKLVDKFN